MTQANTRSDQLLEREDDHNKRRETIILRGGKILRPSLSDSGTNVVIDINLGHNLSTERRLLHCFFPLLDKNVTTGVEAYVFLQNALS